MTTKQKLIRIINNHGECTGDNGLTNSCDDCPFQPPKEIPCYRQDSKHTINDIVLIAAKEYLKEIKQVERKLKYLENL